MTAERGEVIVGFCTTAGEAPSAEWCEEGQRWLGWSWSYRAIPFPTPERPCLWALVGDVGQGGGTRVELVGRIADG